MYTEEETELLRTRYSAHPCPETVEELAECLSKSKKSIIGKLSRLGIYQRIQYKTKTGEDPVTKAELVHRISLALKADLPGLEKAPKATLKTLCLNLSV